MPNIEPGQAEAGHVGFQEGQEEMSEEAVAADKAATYTIRHRWLSNGGEWQVICGRRVVYRCDLEAQAEKWIAEKT